MALDGEPLALRHARLLPGGDRVRRGAVWTDCDGRKWHSHASDAEGIQAFADRISAPLCLGIVEVRP